MANSAEKPFDSPDWIFEIKLDGYRAVTVFDDAGKPHLWSRNGLPLEQNFPAVANAVSKLLIHRPIEEENEDRRCIWRPDQAGFDSRSIFDGALVEE